MDEVVRNLAVLGSPIAHSLSPTLHTAAYRVLGLPYRYRALDVDESGLGDFIAALDDTWLGLSLTMPLKRVVMPMLDWASPLARQLSVANTVRFEETPTERTRAEDMEHRLSGWNTDVAGIVAAILGTGAEAKARPAVRTALVLGSGATAWSAIAAAAQLGAQHVTVAARRAAPAAAAVEFAGSLGVAGRPIALGTLTHDGGVRADITVSTLPAHVADELELRPIRSPAAPRQVNGPDPDGFVPQRQVLLDVAYAAGRSSLAHRWAAAGGVAVSGVEMLIHQAVRQVRVFVTGQERDPLDTEPEVEAAMREALAHRGVEAGGIIG